MDKKTGSKKNGVVKNSDFKHQTLVVSSATKTLSNRSSYKSFPMLGVISAMKCVKLSTKAIIFIVAISTLPVLGIGAFAYDVANESATKEVTYNKQDKARFLIENINRFMQRRYGDIQILSNLTFLKNRKLRETITGEQMQARLSNFFNIENSYESIAVLDLNGNVIAESKGQSIPNQKNEEYFQAVLKTNTPYISQPLSKKSGEKAEIYVAAPVTDSETNQTIYIIRTVMPVKSLEKALNTPQISQDDYALVDASGKILLCKTNQDVGKDVRELFPQWEQMQAENKVTTRILFNKGE